jgi:hypothetical protein
VARWVKSPHMFRKRIGRGPDQPGGLTVREMFH